MNFLDFLFVLLHVEGLLDDPHDRESLFPPLLGLYVFYASFAMHEAAFPVALLILITSCAPSFASHTCKNHTSLTTGLQPDASISPSRICPSTGTTTGLRTRLTWRSGASARRTRGGLPGQSTPWASKCSAHRLFSPIRGTTAAPCA